ncbi:MAG TPA: cbb3-type cytochrome c oxidase subunit I, partial [Gemmatimonadaceae bacterium]|nr:cbb3-type cytochrome c oxidase subunit I [Gemmatimonadaceae bacterium]
FPKITGRLLDERLGRWNFWVMFVGFNLGFFPMHISGLLGMPRRVYTYPGGMGWDTLNLITTIGSVLFAVGVLLFVANVVYSRRHGVVAGPNPWDAGTLEWATPSPPPPYNFAVIPTVRSGYPLWEERLAAAAPEETRGAGERSVVFRGPVLDEGRETFATSPIEADERAVMRMPEDSLLPLLLASATLAAFYGALFSLWWLAALGALGVLAVLVAWLRPRPVAGGAAA